MVNGHAQSQTDPHPSLPSFNFLLFTQVIFTFVVFEGVIVLWLHGLNPLTWLSKHTPHLIAPLCTCDPHVNLIYIIFFS